MERWPHLTLLSATHCGIKRLFLPSLWHTLMEKETVEAEDADVERVHSFSLSFHGSWPSCAPQFLFVCLNLPFACEKFHKTSTNKSCVAHLIIQVHRHRELLGPSKRQRGLPSGSWVWGKAPKSWTVKVKGFSLLAEHIAGTQKGRGSNPQPRSQ